MVMEALLGPIAELLVAPIGRQLGYLIYYNKNVKNLKQEVAELINFKDTTLQRKHNSALENGETISPEVEVWKHKVIAVDEKARTFQPRCWNASRYSRSRKAKKMTLDDVKKLQETRLKFESGPISFYISSTWPKPRTTTSTTAESNEISSLANDVLEEIRKDEDELYMIGIHGVNGDHMKRLVDAIFIKAKGEFDYGVRAIEKYDKREIQNQMVDGLGMTEFSANKSNNARRDRLSDRLMDNTTKLILFEDVCEEGLDLEAIGIPFGEGEWNKRCKIIVTSSDESICEKMKTQKNYKLEVHKQMLLFGDRSAGDLWDDKAHTTIRSIIVSYNAKGICSFQTQYDDNGRWSRSPYHVFVCKSTDDTEEKIKLRHPDEFLIAVSGYYTSSESNHVVLNSLQFDSNKQTYGPYGPETGQRFTSSALGGKIIGFYGRNIGHDSLCALGYYYEESISNLAGPEQQPTSIPAGPDQPISDFGGSDGSSDHVYLDRLLGAYNSEPIPAQRDITMFYQVGGHGGGPWDDGAGHTTVRQIILKVGPERVITHLHVEYDNNGISDWRAHGDDSFHTKCVITLDYPDEFLISMSGTTRDLYGWGVVSSLVFQSNRRIFPPYGDQSGDYFSTSPEYSGKIVGFHGKSGAHLDSIGAYFETFSNS